MNDVQTLCDVERILSEKGYNPKLNDNSVTVPVGNVECPFPCVILMDETNLTISCEVATWGQLKAKVASEMQEDLFLALLDMNSQILPYAFPHMKTDSRKKSSGYFFLLSPYGLL